MEIQLVHSKGDQSWIFTGRTDVEAETLIFWPPDVNNWLIWKDPYLGKIEGKRRRGWERMRWLGGITNSMDMSLSNPGVGDGQGGLASCSPWGHKESDTTEQLNWTELKIFMSIFMENLSCFLAGWFQSLKQIYIWFSPLLEIFLNNIWSYFSFKDFVILSMKTSWSVDMFCGRYFNTCSIVIDIE